MSRPAKTTKLRVIDGDAPSRINEREPKLPTPRRLPAAPAWLSDEAKAVFRREARILHDADMLTAADVAHLARYAALEVAFRKHVATLDAAALLPTTAGALRANPAGSTTVSLAQALRGYASDLGLSAAARSSIRTASDETVDADDDLRRLIR